MKKIYVVIVLVILMVAMFGASFSAIAPKGGGGKPPKDEEPPTPADPEIVYSNGVRDSPYSLWVMDADGSHQTPIATPEGLSIAFKSWSPDKSSIALACPLVNHYDLYLWCIDISLDENGQPQGSNLRQLTTANMEYGKAAWSPNGDKIAFIQASNSQNDPPYSIWLCTVADGTTEKIYTDPDDCLESVTWDPTGTKLAFIKDTKIIDSVWYAPEIHVFDLTTRTLEIIYTFPNSMRPSYYNSDIDWANNDDKIAFCDGHKIVYYDISDDSVTTLDQSFYAKYPAWSPDDSKIGYQFSDADAKGRKQKFYVNAIDVSTQEIVSLGEGTLPDW
jgi:Tol biopolymer transport system component